jgi:hypothetical protein
MLLSLQLCHFCQAVMRGSHASCLIVECLPSLSLVYLVPGFELSFCYKYCRFNERVQLTVTGVIILCYNHTLL